MPVATHSEGPYPVAPVVVTQALIGSWTVTGRDGLKISGSSLVVLVL
jgi:hypothetical protein